MTTTTVTKATPTSTTAKSEQLDDMNDNVYASFVDVTGIEDQENEIPEAVVPKPKQLTKSAKAPKKTSKNILSRGT